MANVKKLNKQGNELFRNGEYNEAIEMFSNAIKKEGPKWHICRNRAKAYFEVKNYAWVLVDCDTCLNFKPDCVEALLLKAKAHIALEQASNAKSAYEKALKIDPNCSEAIEGLKNCSDPEELRKRAMRDPKVQKVLKDPAMRMILEQIQNDPQAIQELLKNPVIPEDDDNDNDDSEESDDEDEIIEEETEKLNQLKNQMIQATANYDKARSSMKRKANSSDNFAPSPKVAKVDDSKGNTDQ